MSVEDRLTYWKRRARDAERMGEYEKEHNKHTLAWAKDAFDEQRRLGDRCTQLYVLAARLGATDEQLRGESVPAGDPVPLLTLVSTWNRETKSWDAA